MCLAASIITAFNVCISQQNNFADIKLFNNAAFVNLRASINFEVVLHLITNRTDPV